MLPRNACHKPRHQWTVVRLGSNNVREQTDLHALFTHRTRLAVHIADMLMSKSHHYDDLEVVAGFSSELKTALYQR